MAEVDVVPVGTYRLPGGARDGTMRHRAGVLTRLLHIGGEPVLVRAWVAGRAVRIRAEGPRHDCAAVGIERMRFALGTDHDLRPFQRAFWRHPLLGPILRRKPWLRPPRRPEPFEALAWAVCEQLIDSRSAVAIERKMVARHGRRSACGQWRDAPSAEEVSRLAPAEAEACGLSPSRAVTLVRAAREVASGRVDLSAHEPAWARLRAISGIGPWTVECLAFNGQGRDDQLPAGDLAYIKLVGRLAHLGRRATEDEVREFFAPFAPYAGLAGTYLAHGAMTGAFGPAHRSLL